MLYTRFVMNTKPNVPDEIRSGSDDYTWHRDWQVNGWLFVAALISFFADVMFSYLVKQWPLGWRISVVVAEFLAIALWARSLVRWIGGMDEMHRRITVSAVLFYVGATFFMLLLWHRLESAGLFDAIFSKPKPGGSWDICTIGHGYFLLTLFYFVSYSVFNRRYK